MNGQGEKAANDIHSVFARDAGDSAYAVIVDNEEGTDVDIIDITDPRKPFLTAEYDLDQLFPQILQAAPSNLVEVFLHDMVVKEIDGRQVMLAVLLGRRLREGRLHRRAQPGLPGRHRLHPDPEALESGYSVPPESNGHEAEFTLDNRYVIGADEDFGPYALLARNVDDGTDIEASQGSDTTQQVEGQTISGESKFVGRARNTDTAVPAGDGSQLAVVERGVCTFTEKVANLINAGGYAAVLVFNREGSDVCNQTPGMSVAGGIPTFGVAPREQGFAIFDAEGSHGDAAAWPGTGRSRHRSP